MFDAVRRLNDDKSYWEKENLHFLTIINLIRDWNAMQPGGHWAIEDLEVPPVAIIKELYHNYRRPLVIPGMVLQTYDAFIQDVS